MLGNLTQCWSAFYDGLVLHSCLEREIREAAIAGRPPSWPMGVSSQTKALGFATLADIASYFLERRNYLEVVATLDLVIHVESLMRDDLDLRVTGGKSRTTTLGAQLFSCLPATGQKPPAARRLLFYWLGAASAAGYNFQLIDEALQYRNWLAHGARGLSPVNALSPFALDQMVSQFAAFIAAEP